MDIDRNQIPEWTWADINRCRLFLHITTVADMVTLDGKYISVTIRELTSKMRQSMLTFPVQKKPSTEDIGHWKYFVDSISNNGHLLVPLWVSGVLDCRIRVFSIFLMRRDPWYIKEPRQAGKFLVDTRSLQEDLKN